MAGTEPRPPATWAFPIVGFSTKSNDSDSSLRRQLRKRAENRFDYAELVDSAFRTIDLHEAREMIAKAEVSDELRIFLLDLMHA